MISLLGVLFEVDLRLDYGHKVHLCLANDTVGQAEATLSIQQVLQCNLAQIIEVVVVKEQMAASQIAITASSADFLNVVLNSSRHIVVDDRLNIALVNAHRKGDCAAQDTSPIVDELLLDEVALLICLASVIRGCRDAVLVQESGNRISSAPCRSE